MCWSGEKCYEAIRILEVMKDILSPDHSRFVKIYWLLRSYRHSKAYLEHASCLRIDTQGHPADEF